MNNITLTITIIDGTIVKNVCLSNFNKDTISFGRAPDNDIILNSPFISAHHGYYQIKDNKLYLTDNNSTNGTFVNGEKTTNTLLNDGDAIKIDNPNEPLMRGILMMVTYGMVLSDWKILELEKYENITIGRSEKSTIIIPHLSVLLEHATIYKNNNNYYLRANNDKGLVMFNNQILHTTKELTEKDVFFITSSKFIYNKDNKCAIVTKTIDAVPTYTCPEGYTQTINKCIKNDVVEPKLDYYCAVEGSTINNNKCVKTIIIDAISTYSCPSNSYTLDGNTCVNLNNVSNASLNCPASYSQTNNYCSKTISDNSLVVTTNTGTCNSRWTYSNGKCIKEPSSGYSYGLICVSHQPIMWNGNRCDYCQDGTLNSNTRKCETQAIPTGKVSSCSDSSYKYENGTCKKTITANGTYSCPSNAKLINGKCYTNTVAATVKYSCIKGYTLNGTKCERYKTVKPDVKVYDKE